MLYARVGEIREQAVKARLRKGAAFLAQIWNAGIKCEAGWNAACSCEKPTSFCDVKAKWVKIHKRLDWDPGDPYEILAEMTTDMLDHAGLTVTIEFPNGSRVKVGKQGTTVESIVDIKTPEDMLVVERVQAAIS